MRITPFAILTSLLLLAGCGTQPAEPPAAAEPPVAAEPPQAWPEGDLFPLEEGRRWTWKVRSGESAWSVPQTRKGGDIRAQVRGDIPYLFAYGAIHDVGEDVSKSIYAVPSTGPEEFYLDYFYVRMRHDPTLPLLPPERKLGTPWRWRGTLGIDGEDAEVSTLLTAEAREFIDVPAGRFDCVRIVERVEGGDLVISRWLAAGVGLVRLEVRGTHAGKVVALEGELSAWKAPPSDPNARAAPAPR